VEERLNRDISRIDAGTRHGHYAATSPLQTAMQAVAVEVFLKYPLAYLAGIPIGLARILILIGGLSLWGEIWVAAWNIGLLVLSILGWAIAWRSGHRRFVIISIVVSAYFILGTLFVQTSGIDVRARTMLTPLLVIAAVIALSRWTNKLALNVQPT
ncbi:MAG: hypothetical protein JNM70_22730, partial [Anaerolineae bacterium]|nr:hypothetical protein [Anaerolineae bacterium]